MLTCTIALYTYYVPCGLEWFREVESLVPEEELGLTDTHSDVAAKCHGKVSETLLSNAQCSDAGFSRT